MTCSISFSFLSAPHPLCQGKCLPQVTGSNQSLHKVAVLVTFNIIVECFMFCWKCCKISFASLGRWIVLLHGDLEEADLANCVERGEGTVDHIVKHSNHWRPASQLSSEDWRADWSISTYFCPWFPGFYIIWPWPVPGDPRWDVFNLFIISTERGEGRGRHGPRKWVRIWSRSSTDCGDQTDLQSGMLNSVLFLKTKLKCLNQTWLAATNRPRERVSNHNLRFPDFLRLKLWWCLMPTLASHYQISEASPISVGRAGFTRRKELSDDAKCSHQKY